MEQSTTSEHRDARVVVCPQDGTPEVVELRIFNNPCLAAERKDPTAVECSRFEGAPTDCAKGCIDPA